MAMVMTMASPAWESHPSRRFDVDIASENGLNGRRGRHSQAFLVSPDCVFDASLVPETCRERFVDFTGLTKQVSGEQLTHVCDAGRWCQKLVRVRFVNSKELIKQVSEESERCRATARAAAKQRLRASRRCEGKSACLRRPPLPGYRWRREVGP